jgi:acylphosphatase
MRVHVRVWGRVQGVYFRASTRDQARTLGLQGWVRNRGDGTVELVAEGPEPALKALVAWARRGPPMADVAELEVVWEEAVGLEGFEKRPTL